MSDKARFRWALAVAFCLGLLLANWPWETRLPVLVHIPMLGPFLPKVLQRIGEALIIAPILAIIVDAAAKRLLLKEFAENVSIHIIGRRLPQALREHIFTYLNKPVVRTKWTITYWIENWPQMPGYVKLTTASEYEIENRGEQMERYEFLYEVEDSWFPTVGEAHLKQVSISIPGQKKREYDEATLEIRQKDSKELSGNKIFRIPLDIPPTPSAPSPQSVSRFVAQSVECYRDSFDARFAVPLIPVIETTVVANYEKTEFKVQTYLSTRGDNRAIQRTELDRATKWHITVPLLPGQCIFTRCERRHGEVRPSGTSDGNRNESEAINEQDCNHP